MRVSTVVATAFVLILLVVILYPVAADAGDRRWITNEKGDTVGYVEPAPLSESRMIVRDMNGDGVAMIDQDALGNGALIRDRQGGFIGRLEERLADRGERHTRRDWRDGPRKRWGSHKYRWGK